MSSYSPKKYHIKTFGCQANIADSNTLAGMLEALGFEEVLQKDTGESESKILINLLANIDLFVVNTCSVRQKSEDKVYGLGLVFKKISERNINKPFVVMSGCMVGSSAGKRQRTEFKELQKKTPWVDLYINPSQIHEFPNILKKEDVLSDWAVKKVDLNKVSPKKIDEKHAFVNISSGCDNFCTFCVVPYARGKEKSRSEKEILTEINHFVKRGISEVTLCGQNVNSWGLSPVEKSKLRAGSEHKLPFAELLKKIHEIPKIKKIEFISSNPFDFTQDLIDTLKLPKISNYLHIAVQSGNNEILQKMNRNHTIEEFYDLIEKIKNIRPDMDFGTDIIVGFPGETEKQFMDTVKVFKKNKFNVAYISIYSSREGTKAQKEFKDNISLKEKKRRHAYLTEVWKDSK
jgi:tRNA-2-methylthio-N6-dimethylallyladenosine synthase